MTRITLRASTLSEDIVSALTPLLLYGLVPTLLYAVTLFIW